jgi:hypothetical protein
MTLRERYTRYLVEHGWKRDYTKPQSSKYDKFSHYSKAGWYFLGRSGAIRFNFENKSSMSHSMEHPEKQRMLQWEKEQGYAD